VEWANNIARETSSSSHNGCACYGKFKQGITNTLALPIDKDVVYLPTTVSTLSTPKELVLI
jgi:hypothetical protein